MLKASSGACVVVRSGASVSACDSDVGSLTAVNQAVCTAAFLSAPEQAPGSWRPVRRVRSRTVRHCARSHGPGPQPWPDACS